MMTALLAAATAWLMFYGRIRPAVLLAICAALGLLFALSARHKHTQFLTIDIAAQVSRLNTVNPALKFWTALTLVFLCVSARTPAAGLFLTAAAFALAVCAGGLGTRDYLGFLALPSSFLLLGGLVTLFEVSASRSGVISVPAFGYWLCVSEGAQLRTSLVMSRALGAVSCLYLLSLTTPAAELTGVLRDARCPGALISLMYLIYRYIFILLMMYHSMRTAADSRLGGAAGAAGLRVSGGIYTRLLVRSYLQAGKNFDAMESRCFDAEIRFLESRKDIRPLHAAASFGLIIITLLLVFPAWL